MFFKKKEKKIEKWIQKMDKIVTWIILWWVVASVFWVATKTKKWQEATKIIWKKIKKWGWLFKKVVWNIKRSLK